MTKANFLMSKSSHFMKPGAVAFIPGWVILFIIILSVGMLWPNIFDSSENQNTLLINRVFLAFIIGALMPVFDDLLAFMLGKPFAHHSLFHSLIGSAITYFIFILLSPEVALFALYGNLSHTFFNFYLDRVAFFFPLSYREYGLADILKTSTYMMKVIHYPIIFLLFGLAVFKFFLGL